MVARGYLAFTLEVIEAITSEALERRLTILDSVALRYPCEVGIRGPHSAFLVLEDEQPNRPIEASDGIGSYELRAQSRIPQKPKAWMVAV